MKYLCYFSWEPDTEIQQAITDHSGEGADV
jgi:hypothetical protein